LKRFSTLNKLTRVIGWIRRWLPVIKEKHKLKQLPNFVTNEERVQGLNMCKKLSQGIGFYEEIENLKRRRQLKQGSTLIPLTPFLDNDNILRVGGRLKHADFDYLSKYPVIIAKTNVRLPLILLYAHQRTLHGGPQMMITFLRRKYWLIDAGNTVKKFVRNCMTCPRQKAETRNQLMGALPICRLRPARPFSTIGVDFAGPFNAGVSKGRGIKSYKAYIALFICMVTKAIHIELVSDMTTCAFLAAYRRFTVRRGVCREMWSDNGTTFVAASEEILEMWRLGNSCIPTELASLLDKEGTKWKFIPPGAPNFGGLWEEGVKSLKYHLKRTIN
jgi:hypothetical protein